MKKDGTPSLTHRAVGGMAWTAWAGAATAILKVAVTVVLTRLLSPADFGVVSAALIVIGFSLIFSQLGVGQALVHRPVLEPRHESTAFVASTAAGFFLGAVMWLAAPLVARFFHMENSLTPVVRALAVLFPIAGASTVAENLIQRQLRFRLLANADVLTYGLGYGLVSVVLAYLGWGVWALVAGQLTQAVLRAAIMLGAVRPTLRPRPTWACFYELMDYGMGQTVARFSMFLANQADNMVVGRWLGADALGVYSRAYQLMSVPTALLGDVLDKVLFPTLARIQDDSRRLASAYLQVTAAISIVMLPAGVVMAVLAHDVVAVAFGRRWMSVALPFQALALGMMFRTSSRMSDSLSKATGNVYRRAWRQALYAAMVFVGALFGRWWGVTGVALGVLVALFVNYLMMAHLSVSVGQISWTRFVQAQLPAVGLAVVLGAIALVLTTGARHLGLPPLIGLAAGAAGTLGTAILLVWTMPTFALGEHGLRMTNALRDYLAMRFRPERARESA